MVTDELLSELINNKYGKCFWNEFYENEEELHKDIEKYDYEICNTWKEFNVTLVNLTDKENIWSSIVVVRAPKRVKVKV